MRVDGTNNGQNVEAVVRLQAHAKPRQAKLASTHGAAEAPPAASAGSAGPTEESRGVIRLLQEGHFRGVADVRLRINFAEELQGVQAARTGAVLSERLPALQEEIDTAIETFLEGGELTEEQVTALRSAQDAFHVQIDALLTREAPADAGDIFAELRTAFEDFLNALLPPQEAEESVAVPTADGEGSEAASEVTSALVPAESGTDPVDDVFAGLRDTLSSIFEEAIGALQESVDAAGLPPLSEPNGNGRAYEKFLAVYNDLYGLGDANAPAAPDTGLDTVS